MGTIGPRVTPGLALLVAVAAVAPHAAAAAPPHPSIVSLTAAPRLLDHRGGTEQLTVRVRGGRRCTFAGQRRAGGGLVPGRTIACASGRASGRLPVQANVLQTAVTIHFQVTVAGAAGQRATRSITVREAAAPPPLELQTGDLPDGMVGSAYSAALSASGGTAPYRWSVASTTVPPGLVLGSSRLTGRPSAPGRFTIAVQVTDADGQSASGRLDLDVIPSLLAPPTAVAGVVPDDLSVNWAGYTLLGGPFTAVSGRFNVPSVAPAPNGQGDTAEWVGIDGGDPGGQSILQAGVEESYGQPGGFAVFAWLELYPAPSTVLPLTIKTGDQVTVTIGQTSPGNWEVRVTDDTSTQSWKGDVAYGGPATSAEWIVEAPSDAGGAQLPLAPFSPVTFTNLGISTPGSSARNLMVTDDGASIATPSSLDGVGFTVAASAATPPGP